MRLFIPVTSPSGLAAEVSAHFGSAPVFAVVGAGGKDVGFEVVPERQGAECGGWRRVGMRAGDTVVCAHLGGNALAALHAAGVTVLRTGDLTVGEVIGSWRAGRLVTFTSEAGHACCRD